MLNGYQAIAYTRIRYSDNAIKRDARQRKVLMSVLRDLKNKATSKRSSSIPFVKKEVYSC